LGCTSLEDVMFGNPNVEIHKNSFEGCPCEEKTKKYV